MSTQAAVGKVRSLTFTHATHIATGAEHDYHAAVAETREEAVSVETMAVSVVTWLAVSGFAIWFCFWLAKVVARVAGQVG